MIRLTGQLVCQTMQQAETVAQHLPEHIRLSRAEVGCIKFDVQQTDNPLVWQVDETFANQSAFEAHQRRTRESVWWKETASIARNFKVAEH